MSWLLNEIASFSLTEKNLMAPRLSSKSNAFSNFFDPK